MTLGRKTLQAIRDEARTQMIEAAWPTSGHWAVLNRAADALDALLARDEEDEGGTPAPAAPVIDDVADIQNAFKEARKVLDEQRKAHAERQRREHEEYLRKQGIIDNLRERAKKIAAAEREEAEALDAAEIPLANERNPMSTYRVEVAGSTVLETDDFRQAQALACSQLQSGKRTHLLAVLAIDGQGFPIWDRLSRWNTLGERRERPNHP